MEAQVRSKHEVLVADVLGALALQVVEALDRYIVGQGAAKKAVANALRNRWRRHKVPSPLRVSSRRGVGWARVCVGGSRAYTGHRTQACTLLPMCSAAYSALAQHTGRACLTVLRRRSLPRTCS